MGLWSYYFLRHVRWIGVNKTTGRGETSQPGTSILLAQGKTHGSMLNNAPTKPRLPALSETPVKQEKSHPR
jgi:hypothetical protein